MTNVQIDNKESKEDSKRLKWYLPAGRVKPTESCDEAIIRIVHEEAGIRVLQKLPSKFSRAVLV